MFNLENIKGIVECPNPVDLMDVKKGSIIESQLPLFYNYFNTGEFKEYLKYNCQGTSSFRFFQDLWLSPKDVVSVWKSYTPSRHGCSFRITYPEQRFSLDRAKKLAGFLNYFAFPSEAPGFVYSIESDNVPVPYHFQITITLLHS